MLEDILKTDPDALAALVASGSKIAICKTINGVPSELVRALIRNEVSNLHLVCVPTGGYAADLLIGAGSIATLETSAVTLDETGFAPRFTEAVKSGAIRLLDSTCPAVYTGIQAAEKGIPFMPIRGLIGSDLMAVRSEYRIIDNPYENRDPIVVVPAITPDFALIHAAMADEHGNVYFGKDRDLASVAHASRHTLATVEKIHSGNLLDDPLLAAGTMSSLYVHGIALAEHGAWPLGLLDHYEEDREHMAVYRNMALSDEGFANYLEDYVALSPQAA